MKFNLKWIKTVRDKPSSSTSMNYFDQANDWSDDYYLTILGSRNRYRVACLLLFFLCVCLVLCICILVPCQHVEPFLIHHYASGAIAVDRVRTDATPLSEAQTESDLIRYVIQRESYAAHAYQRQFSLVYLLSSEKVARQYQHQQQTTNPTSYVTQYGHKYQRKVHIESVIFLDDIHLTRGNHVHQNLAEVNFTVEIENMNTNQSQKKPYVATISWNYGQIPVDPKKRWENWSGFEVISYQVSQRSL